MEQDNLLNDFQLHLQNNFPYLKNKQLLLAVSGGVDSVVLTQLLYELGFDISLAHVNFQLRGKEADADAEFVKKLAENLKIPFYTTRFDTRNYAKEQGLSIQEAARNLRYQWFEELAETQGFDFILTAHHADDNIETVLINLIRGTGIEGLTGIPERNKRIIRPLLPFSREKIENFAKSHKISWREDQSNRETKYTRNRIRHDILPVLKELNPNFNAVFLQTLSHLKDSAAIVKQRIKKAQCTAATRDKDGTIRIDIHKLKTFKPVKAHLYGMLKDFGFTEWNDILALLDAQSGKQVLSKTHRLLKDRDFLLLTPLKEEKQETIEIRIEAGQQEATFEGKRFRISEVPPDITPVTGKNTIFVDKNRLKFPLIVRKWKNGDYFYPLGMNGRKKLSKYFKDEKIPVPEKEKIPLLCSAGKIVWVVGKRPDDRFKINETTQEILKITYEEDPYTI